MLGGLTIFCLGLIGIYISKLFIEVKQRPYTIIRRIYGPNFMPQESASLKAAFDFAQPVSGERRKEDLEGSARSERR